jgi:nicotinamidase-related amidase
MRALSSFLLALAAGGLLVHTVSGSQPKESATENTALLIIDIQNFYFEGGRIPLVGSVEASVRAQKLLQACRGKRMPVIHVRHLPKNIPLDGRGLTDAQYSIHKNVAPQEGEKLIGKHYANSFRDTELKDYLAQKGIRRLIICGMQTHMCVEAAARAAADFGFDVILVEDACATRNLKYKDVEIDARHVHAAVLAALKDTYAQIVTTDEMIKSLEEALPK